MPTGIEETALSIALAAAKAHLAAALAHAEAKAEEDVESCQGYLKAARDAINGLEEEYDEILIEAKYLDREDDDSRQALAKRIDSYLHVDRLRLVLTDATAGLHRSKAALRDDAGSFLRPLGKGKRREAVDELSRVLEKLVSYLDRLGPRVGPSGVGTADLFTVARFVNSGWQATELRDAVADMQAQRSRPHLEHTEEIGGLIKELRVAFR